MTDTTTAAAPAGDATAAATTAAAPVSAAGTPAPAAAAPAGDAPKATLATAGSDGAKADGDGPDDGAKKADEEAKPAGAPEKYEDFKVPDGVELDARVMEEFSSAARELNLPQDAAQKLIDKMQPMIQARQAERVEAVRGEWQAASKADKEFGGEQLTANLAHAHKAMSQFGTPELTKLLDASGLGDNPEVIRFMVRAGKALAEDKVVTGGVPASGAGRTAAQVLYPPKQ